METHVFQGWSQVRQSSLAVLVQGDPGQSFMPFGLVLEPDVAASIFPSHAVQVLDVSSSDLELGRRGVVIGETRGPSSYHSRGGLSPMPPADDFGDLLSRASGLVPSSRWKSTEVPPKLSTNRFSRLLARLVE